VDPFDAVQAAQGGAPALNADGTAPSKEKDLAPEIRKEVRQVTQRLVSALSASGEKDVNSQEVYEWALQVTLRRHKIGDFLEAPPETTTSMDIDQMQQAAMNLMEQPEKAGPLSYFSTSEEVLGLSPEEFENDLESNVRQLLLNAISELVGDAINSLPGKIWKDERASATMRSLLISEFAPTADVLMESIVAKDYKRWLETLKLDSGSVKHKQQFEKLHDNFQEVLSADITAAVVQQICRAVVAADELYAMVQGRAIEHAKAGKNLDEDEEDEEGLDGTAQFGGAGSLDEAF